MPPFKPVQFAVYQASKTRGQTVQPCVHQIASAYDGAEDLFQMVETKCSLCGVSHNFTLTKTYSLATPGQKKAFESFCEDRNIEVL